MPARSDPWPATWTPKLERFFKRLSAGRASGLGLGGSPTLDDIITKSPWTDVRAYGAVGDGATDDYTAFVNALAAGTHILIPPGTYRIASSLTITEPNTLWIMKGAMLDPDNGVAITIDGSLIAGQYQIFTGNGADEIVFGYHVPMAYAEWWGVAVGDTSANETINDTALQNALTCCFSGTATTSYYTGRLRLPKGVIRYSATMYAGDAAGYGHRGILEGISDGLYESATSPRANFGANASCLTLLYYTGSSDAFRVRQNNFQMGRLLLEGTSSAAHGIRVGDKTNSGPTSQNNSHFYDMGITHFSNTGSAAMYLDRDNANTGMVCDRVSFNASYDGLYLQQSGGTGYVTTAHFNDCMSQFNTRYGLYQEGGTVSSIYFYAPLFQHNGANAIYVNGGVGPYHFYSPYFERNNEDTAGYTCFFQGASGIGNHLRACSMINPIFISNLDSTTGELYLNYTRDFSFTSEVVPTAEEPLTITLANTNPGFARYPFPRTVALPDEATPSVAGLKNVLSGGTTAITDFDDGVEGQVILLIAEHSLTITDGTNIFLSGSANWSMTATDTLTLICKADNKWYEISRSDSGA